MASHFFGRESVSQGPEPVLCLFLRRGTGTSADLHAGTGKGEPGTDRQSAAISPGADLHAGTGKGEPGRDRQSTARAPGADLHPRMGKGEPGRDLEMNRKNCGNHRKPEECSFLRFSFLPVSAFLPRGCTASSRGPERGVRKVRTPQGRRPGNSRGTGW